MISTQNLYKEALGKLSKHLAEGQQLLNELDKSKTGHTAVKAKSMLQKALVSLFVLRCVVYYISLLVQTKKKDLTVLIELNSLEHFYTKCIHTNYSRRFIIFFTKMTNVYSCM